MVERWSTFAANEEAKVTAPIRFAWTQLDENWHEETRHSAMLQLAAKHNVFAWVAKRYREKAKTGDELAAQQVEKLRKQAEATLMAGAAARTDNRKRNSYIALGIALVILAVIGYVIYSGTERVTPTAGQTR